MAMRKDRPSSTQIRESLRKLCSEPELARSPQLVEFLNYVVDKYIAGEESLLKAYSIATDVFGRETDFDPQTDSIVRVQAGRLRKVLDTLYERGVPGVDVRIDLPVGRYAPRFDWVDSGADSAVGSKRFDGASVKGASRTPLARPRARAVLIWFVSVALVVAAGLAIVIHLPFSGRARDAPAAWGRPIVIVGGFGSPNSRGDSGASTFEALLLQRLGAFDGLDVRVASRGTQSDNPEGDQVYRVSGEISEHDWLVVARVMVTRLNTSAVVWAHEFTRSSVGLSSDETLRQLADRVSADIGGLRGVVNADARQLLPESAFTGGSIYACGLLYHDALGFGRVSETRQARACYEGYLSIHGADIIAQAGLASLDSFVALRNATPDDDLRNSLWAEVAAGADAVRAYPLSSRVRAAYARILFAAGDIDGARREFLKSISLNPNYGDAEAQLGIMETLAGRQDQRFHIERAISKTFWPSGWFYTIRALDSLRHGDYRGALRYALTIMPDDPELGLAVLVAAAPGAERLDILTVNVPALLAVPPFASTGIMRRLSMRIADRNFLDALRTGLLRAGITPAQLDRPYTD